MANCAIDSETDLSDMTYKFRLDITMSEAELKYLTMEQLCDLTTALKSETKVSSKLSVMADLFKILGR